MADEVKDQTSAVVALAKLTFTETQTMQNYVTITNESGGYLLVKRKAELYTMVVEVRNVNRFFQAFRPARSSGSFVRS